MNVMSIELDDVRPIFVDPGVERTQLQTNRVDGSVGIKVALSDG